MDEETFVTDEKDEREGKGIWDDTDPIVNLGKRYGKKIFYTKQIAKFCANEIICRTYLKIIGFRYIADTKDIEVYSEKDEKEAAKTTELTNYLKNLTDENDIKNNFDDIRDNLENTIKELQCEKIIIYIEIGDDIKNNFNIIAENYENNKDEINSHIKEVFEMLKALHNLNFLHLDIKPGNFLYAKRDGKTSILFNDFDTSFILNPKSMSCYTDSYGSPPYSAPEMLGCFYGDFEKKVDYKTDIFMAGLICYQLLNDNMLPQKIQEYKGKLDDTVNNIDYDTKDLVEDLKDHYTCISQKEENISPPQHGDKQYVNAVMEALSINPDDRPTVEEILHILDPNKSSPNKLKVLFKCLIATIGLFMGLLLVTLVLNDNFKRNDNTDNTSTESIAVTSTANTETTTITQTVVSTYTGTETQDTVTTLTSPTTIVSSKITDIKHENTTNEENKNETDTKSATVEDSSIVTAKNETEPTSDHTTYMTESTETTVTEPVFEYVQAIVEGGDYFDDVSGIMITGFNGNLPDDFSIPDQINGENVVAIGDDAFSGCDIKSLVVPDTVFKIGARAFRSCPYLSDIYLGKNVIIIGEQAFFNSQFEGNEIQKITITNPTHDIEEKFHGKQWDGRENDYKLIFKY